MRLHIGQGAGHGAATVFPVWHDRPVGPGRRYTTRTTHLDVAEADGGPAVAALGVRNRGTRPVLVLEGQLFEGGWQHRMALHSTLVAAGAARDLEVACVEQHRWSGATAQRTRGRRATTRVRAGYDVGGQLEVWQRIAGVGAIADGGTHSLADRLDAGDLDRSLAQLVRRAPILSGQCGVVLGVGGQPLALEVFDHPRTLREQYRPLLRAALLDGLEAPAVVTPSRRARRFGARIESALGTLRPTDDPGRLRARDDDVDAVLLRSGTAPLHLRSTHRRHPLLAAA